MRERTSHQRLSVDDPTVAAWIAECGIAAGPVSVRLVGQTEEDVMVQVRRLEKTFGERVRMTRASHNRNGGEWIAYGTLLY